MKTIDDILAGEQHFEKYAYSGIYFLISKNNIVYIGSSINVGARLFSHRSDKRKRFTGFSIIKYEDLTKMRLDEIKYIQKFKPKYNFYYNPDSYNHKRILFSKYLQIKNLSKWIKENNLRYDKVNAFFRDEKVNPDIIKRIELALYPNGIPSQLYKFDHNRKFTLQDFINNDRKHKNNSIDNE